MLTALVSATNNQSPRFSRLERSVKSPEADGMWPLPSRHSPPLTWARVYCRALMVSSGRRGAGREFHEDANKIVVAPAVFAGGFRPIGCALPLGGAGGFACQLSPACCEGPCRE